MISQHPMPFSHSGLDACEDKRSLAHLKAYLEDSRSQAIILYKGQPALSPDMRLLRVRPSEIIGVNLYDPGPVFLGTTEDGPLFAFSIEGPTDDFPEPLFQNLRMAGSRMPGSELAIAGRAKALFDWHFHHRFCANCGAPTKGQEGGLKRVCETCTTEHFPRVNPVAIMLIEHGDYCLLGRGLGWPDKVYSALAGFVSPGESLEECCIREVAEEVGLKVHSPRYVFSQAWPFPSQLMMGLICQAESRDITINPAEIEDAQWFSRETVAQVIAKQSDVFFCPPRVTIAHQLLKAWLAD